MLPRYYRFASAFVSGRPEEQRRDEDPESKQPGKIKAGSHEWGKNAK
jgi:hypothetical protein